MESASAAESQHSKPSSTAPSASEKAAAARVKEISRPNSDEQQRRKRRRNMIIIGAVVVVVLLAVIIPVAVVFANKSSDSSNGSSSSDSSPSSTGPGPHNTDESDVPNWAKGTYLDPATWYDTVDFNLTFTDEKIGGLYIMGLNSTWDDSTQANPNVPPLNKAWDYGNVKYRGINMGGLISIEPFLSPSLFSPEKGIIDEWTLGEKLGPTKAHETVEKHYSQFASEDDFAQMASHGFDHVRIPFPYWVVKIYDNEPYVPMVGWRYLLRSIEWCRQHGLRVFLDLHAVPGSQNGWTHSGRVGPIDWLTGPQGQLNGQRTIEIHKQLSTFFSQPRYKNLVTMYGLVNEPYMPKIGPQLVLDWYAKAIPVIRDAGFNGLLIMSAGFYNNWQGKMQQYKDLVLDMHQYLVYSDYTIGLEHADKVSFVCETWTEMAQNSSNKAIGFGPTMVGEWSYADTECALYQNGVGVGSRWDGTYPNTPPSCPLQNAQCDCKPANDPSSYSAEYKQWMSTFLMAQMDAFTSGWGWFHWTWKADNNEIASQWTYKDGVDAGFLPKDIRNPTWTCADAVPNFAAAGLPETY